MGKAGVLTIDVNAGTAQFIVDMDKANAKLKSFGDGAGQAGAHTVSSMQAASASIRFMEGDITRNVRAMERLISMSPLLSRAVQAAFIPVAVVTFAGVIAKLGAEVYEFFKRSQEAPAKMATAFRDLQQPLTTTNDELAVSNDRLANQIAKLQGRPENALAEQLDLARLNSDKLSESLDKVLDRMQKAMSGNKTPWWQLLTPGTSAADKRAVSLRSQVGADSGDPNIQSQDYQAELANVNQDLLATLNKKSHEVGRVDFGPEIARLKQYAADYQSEIDRIAAEQKQTAQTQQRDALQKAKENAEAVKRAGHDAAQAQHEADDEQLATMQADHQMSVSEVIAYWQARRNVDAQNTAYQGEITKTLGHLYQEEARQIEESQARIQQAAERLYEANRRTQESVREMQATFARSAEKYSEEAGKHYADDAKKSYEPKPELAQIPITVEGERALMSGDNSAGDLPVLRQSWGLSTAAADIQHAHQAGIQTPNTVNAGIAQDAKNLELAQRVGASLGEQLDLRKKIVEAQIDQGIAEGKNVSTLQGQLANLQMQQTLQKWSAISTGSMYASVVGSAMQFPASLGNALSSGIFGGKKGEDVGKQVGDALKNAGKQLFGQVLTQSIEKLIGVTLLHTAATTAGTGATLSGTVATIGHTISTDAQIVATNLNTWWLAVKSFLGFAGGGNPAPGVPYWVGEHGPELRVDGPGMIVPHDASMDFVKRAGSRTGPSSGGYSSTTHNHGNHTFNIYESPDARASARHITSFLKSTMPNGAAFSS